MKNINIKVTICLALAMVCLQLAWADESELVRGAYVRQDIVKTERSESFVCTLSGVACPSLSFFLAREVTTVYHEVNMYQAMRREPVGKNADGDLEYDLVVVPGKFLEGERNRRVETRVIGPLVNESLLVNGKEMRTDDFGAITDEGDLGILAVFDNLKVFNYNVKFEHKVLGIKEITVYRSIPRRQSADERNLDEPLKNDILVAFNRDFTKKREQPERENLEVVIEDMPEKLMPGQRLKLTVKVINHGDRETNCLLARTFSRQSWLDGRLLYLGNIEPGKSQEFTRIFEVPENLVADRAFVEIAFQDSWGPLPEMAQFRCCDFGR